VKNDVGIRGENGTAILAKSVVIEMAKNEKLPFLGIEKVLAFDVTKIKLFQLRFRIGYAIHSITPIMLSGREC
jgi:hypothetical protein